jgi:hypothetical protein
MRLKDFNEIKRMCLCPWCEDDAYGLGWGVIKPQAMVEAKAACHHGDSSKGVLDLVRLYVGYYTIRSDATKYTLNLYKFKALLSKLFLTLTQLESTNPTYLSLTQSDYLNNTFKPSHCVDRFLALILV